MYKQLLMNFKPVILVLSPPATILNELTALPAKLSPASNKASPVDEITLTFLSMYTGNLPKNNPWKSKVAPSGTTDTKLPDSSK